MQGRPGSLMGPIVAGMVLARCRCCAQPHELETDAAIDANHRVCPGTLRVYLDRGDGLFDDTGTVLPARSRGVAPAPPAPSEESGPDVLSDRPRRTDEKARISLERATFA
jgi:hypothetical protein